MPSLREYARKRRFDRTAEPRGAVAREGARHGVATPANEAITVLVKACSSQGALPPSTPGEAKR